MTLFFSSGELRNVPYVYATYGKLYIDTTSKLVLKHNEHITLSITSMQLCYTKLEMNQNDGGLNRNTSTQVYSQGWSPESM